MVNQQQPFRVHHIARAFRAAERAGIKNPQVRITLPGGGEVPEAPPKKSRQLRADLAEGGSTRMAGRGDRTVTADTDAAGKQRPGSTAHETSSRGSVLAEGGGKGKMFPRQAAQTAKPGQTGKPVSDSKQASGGIS